MNKDRQQTSKVPPGAIDLLSRPQRRQVQTDDVYEVEDEQYYAQRPHTSVRRYDIPAIPAGKNARYQFHPDRMQQIPPRRTAKPAPAPAQQKRGWFRSHPLLWLGIGMIIMLALWVLLQMAVSQWNTWQDDLHYGRPRTAQYDVVIDHNDSLAHKTHIIVINLNARIIIIELPGGDFSKSVLYSGPTLYGQGADLEPITLTFQDVNGDGKTDMIVHFQGSKLIYFNQNGKFVLEQSQ